MRQSFPKLQRLLAGLAALALPAGAAAAGKPASGLGYGIYGALLAGAAGAIYLVSRRQRSQLQARNLLPNEEPVTDAATGLYNRAGILRITEGLFANEQIKSGVCVMLISIDHFKSLHDSHGAEAAERVMQQVVDLVLANIRRGDHLGRWGQGEFLLLCTGASEDGALQLAEKLTRAVSGHAFALADAQRVTLSIGIALALPGETFGHTLQRTNGALSNARASGHNAARLADS